jgi:hypothetical protein
METFSRIEPSLLSLTSSFCAGLDLDEKAVQPPVPTETTFKNTPPQQKGLI